MSKNADATMMGLSKVPVMPGRLCCFIGSISAFGITTFFAISGDLNWWLAGLLNGVFLYFLFRP